MTRTVNLFLIIVMLSSVAVAASIKPKTSTTKLIPAFDKTLVEIKVKATAPDYISWEAHRVSPDGKYIARLMTGEGEVARLKVYRYAKTKNKAPLFRPQDVVSRTYTEVAGVAWVPNHNHWLVISTSGDVEIPQLTLWTGTTRRVLRRGRTLGSTMEKFDLRNVSADGRFVIYDYYIFYTDDKHKDKVFKNLKMFLPRS